MWVICNNTSPSIPVGAQHIPEEWRQPAADVIWQAQSLVLHFPDLRLLESCPFTATASFCQTSAGRETCPVLWALCLQRSVHTLNRLSEQFGKEWKYGVKPGGKTTKKSYILILQICVCLYSLWVWRSEWDRVGNLSRLAFVAPHSVWVPDWDWCHDLSSCWSRGTTQLLTWCMVHL